MPDSLTLCAIKKTKSFKSASFQLTAFSNISFFKDEYNEGKIYNPTAIAQHIVNFLSIHGIKKMPITFTINGSHIAQEFISYSDNAQEQPINNQNTLGLTEFCHLYTQENGDKMFYTCTIERSIIMQYQIMAISNKFNLCAISTIPMAHLNIYRFLQGNSWQDSLAGDLKKNNNETSNLVNAQTIESILTIPAHIERTVRNHDEFCIALGSIMPIIQI